MAHNLIEQIRDLAALIASMPPDLLLYDLRIAVVVGDALPWRIVESIAIPCGRNLQRKMSYFRTAEQADGVSGSESSGDSQTVASLVST